MSVSPVSFYLTLSFGNFAFSLFFFLSSKSFENGASGIFTLAEFLRRDSLPSTETPEISGLLLERNDELLKIAEVENVQNEVHAMLQHRREVYRMNCRCI